MAGVKISALPAAGAITGSELVPVVQSGSTVQTTALALRTNLPNSALSQINTSTTDTTNANISRNGDWGIGTTAFAITDFTSTNLNYSQIFRSVSATGGPGVGISGVALPYDGTPTTSYLAVTPGTTTTSIRAWAGTKTGAAGTPVWTELARLASPTFTSNIGIGGINVNYIISAGGTLTLDPVSTGGMNFSSILTDGNRTTVYGVLANPITGASGTLANFRGFQAGISLGGGTVTNAFGFTASNLLGSNATNGYGFFSDLAAGTDKWNFYASGTANNYMAGSLGIGSTSLTAIGLRVSKSITGGGTAFGIVSDGTISNDVNANAALVRTVAITGASVSLPNLVHHQAVQGTFDGSSSVTVQSGFVADSSLIGAGSNYGFRGSIPAATGRWNVYMDGTAQNYILGNVGIGTGKTVPAFPLDVAGQIRGTYVGGVPANTLSAAGSDRATAAALAAQYNVVTGVSSGQGVALPNVIGVPIWVFNNQASFALLIYPSTASQTINALGAGAGFSLAAASKIQLVQVATNVWFTMT